MTPTSTEQGVLDSYDVFKRFFSSFDFKKQIDPTTVYESSIAASKALRSCELSEAAATQANEAVQFACVRMFEAAAVLNGSRNAKTVNLKRAALYLVSIAAPIVLDDWRYVALVVPCAVVEYILFGDSYVLDAIKAAFPKR